MHTKRKKEKMLKCGRILYSVGDFSMIFFVNKYLVYDSTLKLKTVGSIKQIVGCFLRIFYVQGHTVVEFRVGQKNVFVARNPRS